MILKGFNYGKIRRESGKPDYLTALKFAWVFNSAQLIVLLAARLMKRRKYGKENSRYFG